MRNRTLLVSSVALCILTSACYGKGHSTVSVPVTDTPVPTEAVTPTVTETIRPTSTVAPTPTEIAEVPASTLTPSPSPSPTPTPIDECYPSNIPTPTPTATPVPTATNTPAPTATPTTGTESAPYIFAEMTNKYVFTSGAGAWATELYINPDGTFSGLYYDWNAGSGDYPWNYSEEWHAEFHGVFSDPVKINDYTYSFVLTTLIYDTNTGTDEVVPDGDGFLVYRYTTAHGLRKGKTFYYYRKGTELDVLPESFLIHLTPKEMATGVLPHNGIFNEDQPSDFFDFSS